ncbi:MAG: TolC family protein [Gallionellaceae bacterium]|nr:MAG: TolC family protein [Gallionellaceae bacterium]
MSVKLLRGCGILPQSAAASILQWKTLALLCCCAVPPTQAAPLQLNMSLGNAGLALTAEGRTGISAKPSDSAPKIDPPASIAARPAETLFLQKLAAIALQRSPQLRDTEAAWHAAQMDTEDVRGARWPRVDITGTSQAKTFGPGNPYGNGTTNRVGVTLTYNLFDGGKTGKQISAKEHQEISAHAKYLQIREQVVFDTTSVYLQILKYRKLVELHQQNAERLAVLANKMDEIVQVIGGRRSELTQATARLLQAKENRAAAAAKLNEYNVQLLKLIGAENMAKTTGGKMPTITPIPPATGMSVAKQSHPLLVAAEADRLALDDTATAIRKGNYWPVFEVQASKMSGVDIMGYSDPGQMYLTFRWNAFQGFSGKAQEKAVLERANAAQEKYQQAVFDIEYKLNSAWTDYQNQHERIISLRILAMNTEQVRNDYYSQWETLGKRSLLEVLTAENEHVTTMINLASSELDEQLALARLRFESGTLVAWLFDNVG